MKQALLPPAVVSSIREFKPIRVAELELSQPLSEISLLNQTNGQRYSHALCLIRLHGEPVATLELKSESATISSEAVARQIWQAAGAEINRHLQKDGLAKLSELPVGGLTYGENPPCLEEQARLKENAPLVSIIVATRERAESLNLCLQSLVALDYPAYEVIVVDNAPKTSATADLIKQHYANYPQIRYVREDYPGLGVAHNTGVRAAKGEIIATTDDDVLVDKHWLSELVLAFQKGEQVGCVTGFVFPLELETPAQYWFEQHGGFGKGLTRQIYDMGANRPADPLFPYRSSMFGTGANMAFTAQALRSIKGFNPMLGPGTPALGAEDLDIYFRVIMAGFQLVYEPKALVHHCHRREYNELRSQLYGYGASYPVLFLQCLADRPKRLLDLARIIPAGLTFMLKPHPKAEQKQALAYPAELTKTELKGIVYGPLAYGRTRWRFRKKNGLIPGAL